MPDPHCRIGATPRCDPFRRPIRAVLAVGAFVFFGNAIIAIAYGLAVATRGRIAGEPLPGVKHTRKVDERVLRGSAPSARSYRAMAERGVTTVVDLRAERHLDVPAELLADLGITRICLPIRDGQTPTPAQVRRFREIVAGAPGGVFLHCGAGVGRTGSMAAAYLVRTEQARPWSALRANLGAGPLSMEQIWFVLALDPEPAEIRRPPGIVVALSRVLDAPRRLWSVLRRQVESGSRG